MLSKRHNAQRFAWLRRRLLGGEWIARGTIDSATGKVTFYGKGGKGRQIERSAGRVRFDGSTGVAPEKQWEIERTKKPLLVQGFDAPSRT